MDDNFGKVTGIINFPEATKPTVKLDSKYIKFKDLTVLPNGMKFPLTEVVTGIHIKGAGTADIQILKRSYSSEVHLTILVDGNIICENFHIVNLKLVGIDAAHEPICYILESPQIRFEKSFVLFAYRKVEYGYHQYNDEYIKVITTMTRVDEEGV